MLARMRRRDLFTGVGSVAVTLILIPSVACASNPGKVSKAAAIYRSDGPTGKPCIDCRHYVPETLDRPSACHIVDGAIAPDGGCVLWEQQNATGVEVIKS